MIERRKQNTPLGEMTETIVICDGCGERLDLGFVEWDWRWQRIYTGEYPDWIEWALCPQCRHVASWCKDCQAWHLPGQPHRQPPA
jgi:hypothetical protein